MRIRLPELGRRQRVGLYGVSVLAFVGWIATFDLPLGAQGAPSAPAVAPEPPGPTTLPAASYGGRNPFAAPPSFIAASASPSPKTSPTFTTTTVATSAHVGPSGSVVPDFGGGGGQMQTAGPSIVVTSLARVEGTGEAIADVVVGQDVYAVRVGDVLAGERVKSIVLAGDWQGIVLSDGRRIGLNDSRIVAPQFAAPVNQLQSRIGSPGVLPVAASPAPVGSTGPLVTPIYVPFAAPASVPRPAGPPTSAAGSPDPTQGTPHQLLFPQVPLNPSTPQQGSTLQ